MTNLDSDPGIDGGINAIEQLGIADLESVTDFLQPVYADTYPNDRGITKGMFENDTFRQHLKDYLHEKLTDSASSLLALRKDEKIIGTVGLQLEEDGAAAEVWGFYVEPSLQGHGEGRKLWEALASDERTKSINKFHLSVAKDSKKAIEFYKTSGFEIVGEEEWDWPSWVDQPIKNQYWRMEKAGSVTAE